MISRPHVFNLPVEDYASVRPEVQSGDTVLFWGRSLLSRMISGEQHDPSHAATLFVCRELDIVFVLESVEGQGVRVVQFSRLIEAAGTRYDGAVVIVRHRVQSNLAATRTAARLATSDLGEGYGYGTLLLAGMRRVALAVHPRLESWLRNRYDLNRRAPICSERAAEFHLLRGQPLEVYRSPVPEPGDLWRDSHFDVVARVL